MKHIVNCSFGKDSLAMIIKMREAGMPIDEVVYARIMFDDETSAEYPEHEKWIHEVAIPKLESWGMKVTVVQADKTYCSVFSTKFKRGKRIGEQYGFPSTIRAWCNNRLKTEPLNKRIKEISVSDTVSIYTGIAADETRRIPGARKRGEELPLVDMNITEAECFDICREQGLLSPAYEYFARLGCWFCHKSRKIDGLKFIYQKYPEMWDKLINLEKSLPEDHYFRFFGWDYRLLSEIEKVLKGEAE